MSNVRQEKLNDPYPLRTARQKIRDDKQNGKFIVTGAIDGNEAYYPYTSEGLIIELTSNDVKNKPKIHLVFNSPFPDKNELSLEFINQLNQQASKAKNKFTYDVEEVVINPSSIQGEKDQIIPALITWFHHLENLGVKKIVFQA